MKNVLVTAAGSPLARGVMAALHQREGVGHVVALEPSVSSEWTSEAELVPFPASHGEFVTLLAQYPVDTVIHCGLSADRAGTSSEARHARVIDTMQLGAALAHPESSVRSWVIASSSDVYPVSTQAPLLHRELKSVAPNEGTIAASIAEAEDYARDIADRRPHLNVAILRLQHLVGDSVRSPMNALLAQPRLPIPFGYDAHLQLLDLEDAVGALAFAAELELAGVYNVASEGTTRLSAIAAALDKPTLPFVPLEAPTAVSSFGKRLGIPQVPAGLMALLRYGHALDTSKLAAAGFSPTHDQDSCIGRFQPKRPKKRER